MEEEGKRWDVAWFKVTVIQPHGDPGEMSSVSCVYIHSICMYI